MTAISLFISSPGDVAQERRIAERVIDRLNAEFGGAADLKPYFWEYEPMVITQDYQEQIPPPSNFDIVICILWSRMGSRLHSKYQRSDGRDFRSGTEYEFVDAVEGQKENDGIPDVLVWVNKTRPLIPLEPEDEHLERLRQWREMKAFLEEWTRDGEEQTFKGAVNRYGRLDEFEEKLEVKLRKLIVTRLGEVEALPQEVTWKKGSPFRGLEAFDFEHSPVFFGRTSAIAAVIECLRRRVQQQEPAFLLVTGASGSGKSSLVRAGVLPMLIEPGVIEGVGLWRRAVMSPSRSGENLFASLAASLLSPEALPELAGDGMNQRELTRLLEQKPGEVLGLGRGALAHAASFFQAEEKQKLQEKISALEKEGRPEDARQMQDRLDHLEAPQARLVLVIDQFEEIFDDSVESDAREKFVALIRNFAESGRVFVVATMRSDFYPRCAEIPDLAELSRGDGNYLLASPTPPEIGQMIRQPAQAAGLHFEKDPTSGESLDENLRDAASSHSAILPLLQFCLEELYQAKGGGNLLTFEACEKLGGVEGALALRAEETLGSMSGKEQAAFPRLIRATVTMGGGAGEDENVVRRRADYESLSVDPEVKNLADGFVSARLFVADTDDNGRPFVTVAHEALFHSWPRLTEVIDQDREFFRTRARLVEAAGRWKGESEDGGLLLPEGRQLNEATALLEERGEELRADERRFVEISVRAAERRQQRQARRVAIVSGVLLLLAVGAIIGSVFGILGQRKAAKEAIRAENAANEVLQRLGQSDIVTASNQWWPNGHAYLARTVKLNPENWRAKSFLYTRLFQWPHLHPEPLFFDTPGATHCQFDGEGGRLLTWGLLGSAKVWDVESGEILSTAEHGSVNSATITPDGQFFVCSFEGMPARIFAASSGKAVGKPLEGTEGALYLYADPGHPQVAFPMEDRLLFFSIPDGEPNGEPLELGAGFISVGSNTKGDRFAAALEGGKVKVWDGLTRELLYPAIDAGESTNDAVFSPDGETLITVGDDGNIRRWNAESGESLGEPLSLPAGLLEATFSPNGNVLSMIGADNRIHTWDLETESISAEPIPFSDSPVNLEYFPDGQRAIFATQGGVWAIAPPFGYVNLFQIQALPAVTYAAIQPGGKRFAVVSSDGRTRFYGMQFGRPAGLPLPHLGTGVSMIPPPFFPDGSRIAVQEKPGFVQICRTDDGSAAGEPFQASEVLITAIQVGPDGRMLLTGDQNGEVKLWDAASGEAVGFHGRAPPGNSDRWPVALDLNRQGNRVLAGYFGGTIAVWDAKTSRLLWDPVERQPPVTLDARFVDGGRNFLTAGGGDTVTIRNTETGQPEGEPLVQSGAQRLTIRSVSDNGDSRVLVNSNNGAAAVWELKGRKKVVEIDGTSGGGEVLLRETGLPVVAYYGPAGAKVTEPQYGLDLINIYNTRVVESARWSPEGDRLAVNYPEGIVRLWEGLPPEPIENPEWLAELAELLGGLRIPQGENISDEIPDVERVSRLRQMKAEADPETPEGRLALWLFADPNTRTISPNSPVTVPEHILTTIALTEDFPDGPNLEELFFYHPSHPLVWAATAWFDAEARPKYAAWAKKQAEEGGESVAGFLKELSETFAQRGDSDRARHYAEEAAKLEAEPEGN